MLPFLTGVCLLPPITASFCLLRFVFVLFLFFYVSFFGSVCLLPPITSGFCLLVFVFVFVFIFCLIYYYYVFPSQVFVFSCQSHPAFVCWCFQPPEQLYTHSHLKGSKPKKNSPGLRLVPFFVKCLTNHHTKFENRAMSPF